MMITKAAFTFRFCLQRSKRWIYASAFWSSQKSQTWMCNDTICFGNRYWVALLGEAKNIFGEVLQSRKREALSSC